MTPLEALRALGTGHDVPVETKKRVYGALLASLEVAAATGAIAHVVAKAPSTRPPSPMPMLANAVGLKAILVATGVWLLGGAMGAALYGAMRPQQVRVVYVDRPVPATVTPDTVEQLENLPPAAPSLL